jgi:hypothetical protein
MPDLTCYELDALELILRRLRQGERNALVDIRELQGEMPYATVDEVDLALQMLDARGLIKYTPPVTRGMAAIVARPDAPTSSAPLRARRSRRRSRDSVPRGA